MVDQFQDSLVADYGAVTALRPQFTSHGGYSLLTSTHVHPAEVFLFIPKQCLLNVESESIRQRYPRSLTSFQILSSHLTRLRMGDLECTRLESPYLDTLPADFSFHPLCWPQEKLDRLPIHVRKLVEHVSHRFESDFAAFRSHFEASKLLIQKHTQPIAEVFKWAWLVVNTRCLYYPIQDVEKDSQLSLCPYLDLLNHSSPSPNTTNLFNALPKPEIPLREGGYELVNNSTHTIPPDTEICFMYGPHSDDFLLAEYGFVLGWEKNAFTEVNISDLVKQLIKEDWKRDQLQENDLWDDYTLHLYPAPAWPSQRTLMALRMACLSREEEGEWCKVAGYQKESVSDSNENQMRSSLADLCCHLNKVSDEKIQENKPDYAVRVIWENVHSTTSAIQQSVKDNISF
ncbi:hypothetical protein E3P84_00427 [Wallemia ichthyophaga]|nr:hypothetical protein E3P84_00427 [Wallemia ichthyophaga]TIB43843.1 hypothetical protein E3P83_00570 [Wallemia ichthyophaga]